MEVLSLKLMYTALILFLCSAGVMKFIDVDDLPFWATLLTVIVFYVSGVVALIASMIVIWI